MIFIIWFLLWLAACFAGYKLAKARNSLDSDEWLAVFLGLCLLTFLIAKFPG